MILNIEDITGETWKDALSRLHQVNMENSRLLGEDTPAAFIADGGLPAVPLDNREWSRLVGYEHDEQCLWFRQTRKRGCRGRLELARMGAVSARALARAVAWNAALYIHFTGGRLAPGAARRPVSRMLSRSTCPQVLLDWAARELEHMVLLALRAVTSPADGTISRCGLQLLKEEIGPSRLGRRTCTNRALRRHVCMELVCRGIANCSSRTEQRAMLLDRLRVETSLKASAVRGIERLLASDPELLGMNGGRPVLLPWSEGEERFRRQDSHRHPWMEDIMVRVREIQAKQAQGLRLSGADRVFKCSHRDMFMEC